MSVLENTEEAMKKNPLIAFIESKKLCPVKVLGYLQMEGVVSDNCLKIEDVHGGDAWRAVILLTKDKHLLTGLKSFEKKIT
jgi:hypothetical protein